MLLQAQHNPNSSHITVFVLFLFFLHSSKIFVFPSFFVLLVINFSGSQPITGGSQAPSFFPSRVTSNRNHPRREPLPANLYLSTIHPFPLVLCLHPITSQSLPVAGSFSNTPHRIAMNPSASSSRVPHGGRGSHSTSHQKQAEEQPFGLPGRYIEWQKEVLKIKFTLPEITKSRGANLPLGKLVRNTALRKISGWNSASKIKSVRALSDHQNSLEAAERHGAAISAS